MKKYIITSLLAGVALMGFTSCEDDRDSNPTLVVPDTFVLNIPALTGNVYDLERGENIELTCKQPEFGYTAAVSYYTQLSLTDEWKNEVDEKGEVVGLPKFVQLESYSTKAKFNVNAKDFNKALMKLGGYTTEGELPEELNVYVRLNGMLSSGQNTYSNHITLKVKPFFQALVAADPELWYLIGACIGDGSWGSEIGVAVYPMSPVEGAKFDEVTGKGPLTYTGYFTPESGFKIVRVPGQWAEQWGGVDNDITQPRMKDDSGEGADFKVPSAGYYRIDLDTYKNALTFTALDKAPAEYQQMMIAGEFTNWGDGAVKMNPVDTYAGARPHVWMYDLNLNENSVMKFLVDSSWNPNWGDTKFPFGWGVGGGSNIPVAAGNYRVVFNDITGYYHFYKK